MIKYTNKAYVFLLIIVILRLIMGKTKIKDYREDHIQIAQWMKALAHPARIAIVSYLSKQNSCVCGELVDYLPLSQATVSQHLKALKDAGIIQGEIEGTKSCYCLNTEHWNRIQKELSRFLDQLQTNHINCCNNE